MPPAQPTRLRWATTERRKRRSSRLAVAPASAAATTSAFARCTSIIRTAVRSPNGRTATGVLPLPRLSRTPSDFCCSARIVISRNTRSRTKLRSCDAYARSAASAFRRGVVEIRSSATSSAAGSATLPTAARSRFSKSASCRASGNTFVEHPTDAGDGKARVEARQDTTPSCLSGWRMADFRPVQRPACRTKSILAPSPKGTTSGEPAKPRSAPTHNT